MTAPLDPDRYEAAVAALFARRPEVMIPGTERIAALCAELSHPQQRYPAVQLTGTNGKTTSTRMVAALLAAHGLRTGAYTSPHLQDVRERIQLDGRPVAAEALLATLDVLAPATAAVEADRGELVTFFETLTAAALSRFATDAVDVAVCEVGMGGRFDATNVVDGRVALFTRVGLDHAELGSTVAAVAAEKAGIIKPAATVVTAEQEPAADRVITQAARDAGARVCAYGRDYAVTARQVVPGGQVLTLAAAGGASVEAVRLPVHGAHQAANAAGALAAAEALLARTGRRLDSAAVRAAFAGLQAPGRLEAVARPGAATVVLDGAHNPAAARALAASIAAGEIPAGPRVLVVGAMADKDVEGIVAALAGVAAVVVAVPAPTARGAAADRVVVAARHHGLDVTAVRDAADALAAATVAAGPEGVVVVTGSLYLVGAVRDLLGLAPGALTPSAHAPHVSARG